jgi:PAS domain S-box-containing protein
MSNDSFQVTGKERFFGEDEIIVSKTDLKGRITYANDVFLTIAGYEEDDILGQPHNIIRHPAMPRCVFKLLWDQIQGGREIFAYVINRAKLGDHYWVFAHVTPTFDEQGRITGYHSNRRCPRRDAVKTIDGLYKKLLQEESRHPGKKEAMAAGGAMLGQLLEQHGVTYDEFVFTL